MGEESSGLLSIEGCISGVCAILEVVTLRRRKPMGKPSFHVRSAVIFSLVAALFVVPALAWGDELPEETLADNSSNAVAETEQANDEVALLMDSGNQKEKEASPVVDLPESQNDAASAAEEQQGESGAADNAYGEESSLPGPEPVKAGFGQEDVR